LEQGAGAWPWKKIRLIFSGRDGLTGPGRMFIRAGLHPVVRGSEGDGARGGRQSVPPIAWWPREESVPRVRTHDMSGGLDLNGAPLASPLAGVVRFLPSTREGEPTTFESALCNVPPVVAGSGPSVSASHVLLHRERTHSRCGPGSTITRPSFKRCGVTMAPRLRPAVDSKPRLEGGES